MNKEQKIDLLNQLKNGSINIYQFKAKVEQAITTKIKVIHTGPELASSESEIDLSDRTDWPEFETEIEFKTSI